MKLMKKIMVMLLTVTLLVPFAGVQAHAAEGILMFSDPQTKVGDNVSVDMVIQSGGSFIGDIDVTMSYDVASLEFVSGNEVTSDNKGTLTYSHKGNGSETEVHTTLEFRALKQGTANINVTGYTAYLFSDEVLALSEGSSAITIDVGADGSTSVEPSNGGHSATATDIKINVNGIEYSLSEAFNPTEIPDGYSEITLPYSGADRKFVENEKGVKLGYLVDGAGEANFFLYNEENATFSPFVEIFISEETAILLLSDLDGMEMPEQYQKADLIVGDYTFSAWQDMNHQEYYAIYALNEITGEKEVYQYDTVDGTYQRMIFSKNAKQTETNDDGTVLGKLKNVVNSNFKVFFLLVVALLLILFIILIVVSVKLYHRNLELDDLYDEYGIDEENVMEKDLTQKGNNKYSKKTLVQDNYYSDNDYDDDYYYDDDYEDDYYDDDDSDFEEYYDQNSKKKSRNKGKNIDSVDDYDIDFIDL